MRVPASQPTPPKQPSDVSRQLFPADTNSTLPAAIGKPRQASTAQQRPAEPHQQPMSVPQYATQSPVQQPIHSSMHSMSSQVRAPIGERPKISPAVSAPGMQRPNPAYPPYIDNQMSKQPIQPPSQAPIMAAQQQMSYQSSMIGQQQHSDPMKAPGFRPSPSSQLNQYSQHLMLQPGLSGGDEFSRAPGSRASAEQLTSPLNSHSISNNVHTLFSNSNQSPRGSHPPSHSAAAVQGFLNLQNHFGSREPQYTTRDQPMTLPEISSSLNPNASEFNLSNRFGGEGQHSPRGAIGSKQQTSPGEYKQQHHPPISGYQQGRPGSGDSELMRQMFVNSSPVPGGPPQSLNQMAGLLQAVPGQMPMSMQPQRTYSPAGSRQMMTPPMDPTMSHQLDDSPPTLQSDLMESRGPRPIGGERSRRTPVFPDPMDIWNSNPSGTVVFRLYSIDLIEYSFLYYIVPCIELQELMESPTKKLDIFPYLHIIKCQSHQGKWQNFHFPWSHPCTVTAHSFVVAYWIVCPCLTFVLICYRWRLVLT